MSLQKPINPWHMIPNSAEFFIAKDWWDDLLQLGFYKDQSLAPAWESIEDVYSNGVIKKTKDWNKVTVNVDVHELTIEKLAILQSGLVEVHAETVSNESESWMPYEWELDKGLLLKYSNGDWSAVTVSSVKALVNGEEVTLTVTTDYTVWVNVFGASYIKLKATPTTWKLTANSPTNTKITVVYSATNTTAKLMDHKANTLAEPFVMVIVNEFEYQGEKKMIKTFLENCQANKAMLQQIADSDNTTVWFPVEITWVIKKQDFIGFSQTETPTETETETETA